MSYEALQPLWDGEILHKATWLGIGSVTMVEKELFAAFVSTVALHLSGKNLFNMSSERHHVEISAIRNRV